MKILIVAKRTNLEIHGESIKKCVSSGVMSEEYFDRIKKSHQEHYVNLKNIYELLKRHDISYITVDRGHYWPQLSDINAVLTVGGDGTVLEASHHIYDQDVTLLGIRSSKDSVGRLCHIDASKIESIIETLLRGEVKSQLVTRLRAKIFQASNKVTTYSDPVLNDILFTNRSPSSTTRYRINYNGQSELHKSSGIWISTACGSSGVCKAAGGEMVSLEEQNFQFIVRELYSFDNSSKLSKGFFSSEGENSYLEVENHNSHSVLALDGNHGKLDLGFGDRIEFVAGPSLKLAKPEID